MKTQTFILDGVLYWRQLFYKERKKSVKCQYFDTYMCLFMVRLPTKR